jgi:hypothetical protein
MFIKLRLALLCLTYFLGLEISILNPDWVYFVLLLLAIFSFFESQKWKFSILPVLFSIFSVALLRLIALFFEQQIFILSAAGIYYLIILGNHRLNLYEKDQTAKGMLMAGTVTAIFFTFAASYGFYLNFLVPLYVLMMVCLTATFLISYQYFSVIETDQRKISLYCFILALIMGEIIWTMNFWPFGYLTTGVVALILYYVLWDLTQSHFLNLLSRKRVIANMLFFFIMIGFVLLSAKWIPVI